MQDVPEQLAAELAEKVPAIFCLKAATKKTKNRLHVNNIRENEFYEALVCTASWPLIVCEQHPLASLWFHVESSVGSPSTCNQHRAWEYDSHLATTSLRLI